MNPEQAPETVNNFVVLSRYHYYDGVPVFSIVPQAAILTGDATGEPIGRGDPGYTLADEIPEAGVIYPWGTLAMLDPPPEEGADGGGEDRGLSHGSQFLIASGEQASGLPPTLTVFGQVLDGDEPIRAMNEAGTPGTGAPTEEIVIESVEIVEE
ncbi:MAG: peptidylprolyl isomerase [Acidimicrobiia bacterium]|nr:peptidylprolyl isomerase [Acidimicrobiia bacterium]